ncbi:MAG: YigZ family protein [Clostridiales bacterium]|nr:YigZ family protein [Clostridiales bacterium]
MEEYISVAGASEAEFTEKKSRFIGRITPVTSEAEAKAFVESVRAAHREANHHVYAFVIGINGEIQRSSDDGEPAGTAGRPVLEGIKQAGLENVALVVTRYFGGTLLGAGGLTRAYGRAASLAIGQAKAVRCLPAQLMSLSFGYELIGRVESLLASYGAKIRDKSYAETVCYLASVPEARLAKLQKELTEASNGTMRLHDMGERLYLHEEIL